MLSLFLNISCGFDTSVPVPGHSTQQRTIEALYQDYRKSFPDVPEVTPAGVLALQADSEIVLVDVRTPEERAVSMLPGAIDKEAFEASRGRYGDRVVVVYCTIGARSGEYAQTLEEKGVTVSNLKGSILAWTHAGLPLVDSQGRETRKLHTYGKRWDLAAEGYETTW